MIAPESRHFLRFVALALLASSSVAQTSPDTAEQRDLHAHVAYLASDALKGREAGTPEYDAAARYVADQFAAAGLAPAGDAGGYQQAVPLVAYRPAGEPRMVRDGVAMTPGVDFVALADAARATSHVATPVVFVGYGIRDRDYARVRVSGRIVAFLTGVPPGLSGEQRNFLGVGATKADVAARHGAIAAIELATPASERATPFARLVPYYAKPRTTWANPDGTGHRPGAIPILAVVSAGGATKLFAGARRDWAKVARTPPDRVQSEELRGMLTIDSATAFTPGRSSNVVGMIPGADPALAAEAVVLSAHLDHLGVGPADAAGDTIYNGALDDAIGVASLIEEARRFRGRPPRRTIVFVAFTAEEKGLVGSDWFTAHPPAVLGRIVADVNFDMPILTYPFQDMIAFGGDRSTLGPLIARTLATEGIATSPDPLPDEGIFVRSDHFNFVRHGIPAVYLWPGPMGEGAAAIADFMAHHYHRPSDDLKQPIRWDQAVRFVEVNYRIARAIADARTLPRWNRGDYFGTLFGGPMAQ